MQLNELIEEHTLPSISKQTRISIENLEYLLAGEWSRLPQVQALGFISILEREYHIDLSGMKKECKEYNKVHGTQEDISFVIKVEASSEELVEKSITYKVILFLAILTAAFMAWYIFVSKDGISDINSSTSTKKESFYSSVISWFGKQKNKTSGGKIETENRDSEVPAAKGAWQDEKNISDTDKKVAGNDDTGGGSSIKSVTNTDNGAEKPVSSEKNEEAKIIQEVKKEQADKESGTSEPKEPNDVSANAKKNNTIKISDIVGGMNEKEESNASAENSIDKQNENSSNDKESLLPEVPSLAFGNEVGGDEVADNADEKDTKNTAKTDESNSGNTANQIISDVPKGNVIILHPKAKIWLGYTNLKSMKRAANVTNSDVVFDISKAEYIIATGHGKLQFKGKGIDLNMDNGRQHFFRISKKGVREISHEEFQSLNKSKVW